MISKKSELTKTSSLLESSKTYATSSAVSLQLTPTVTEPDLRPPFKISKK
jgi:hypothetical protein